MSVGTVEPSQSSSRAFLSTSCSSGRRKLPSTCSMTQQSSSRDKCSPHTEQSTMMRPSNLIKLSTFIITLCLLCLASVITAIETTNSLHIQPLQVISLTRDTRSPQDLLPDRVNSLDNEQVDSYPKVPRKCYDTNNSPKKCEPGFVNAAYLRQVEVTNVCGLKGPSEYCSQIEVDKQSAQFRRSCDICDGNIKEKAHPAYYLTDVNDANIATWWQSQTMHEGVQNPLHKDFVPQINLTIHLGKAFNIDYIQLKFYSPRPESFAIYKKRTDDSPWIPFQFYSHDCQYVYGLPDKATFTETNETRAACTSEFSDISPLTGGTVVFTTLEGRPSGRDYENSPKIQEFIAATAIRITLDRMNTFGEEIFNDLTVLQSYFYGIYDLAIGGKCKCNGHASECIPVPGQSTDGQTNNTARLMCNCQHNTEGTDCERCKPFYNNQPWKMATDLEANECEACNCNNRSDRCYFDNDLWLRTGNGGHCLDCSDNRDGPYCERCKQYFYESPETSRCVACNCDPTGSADLQCNIQGQCKCKPGVEGLRCDRCAANHYDFSPSGCKSCGCNEAGSLNNTATCDPFTGQCRCKSNVEGLRCSSCKPGHFDLSSENEFGCLPCFCYGHASVCQSAPGFYRTTIESAFSRDNERWTAKTIRNGQDVVINYNPITKNIGASAEDEDVYFIAPSRFLGDQKASYNQHISFTLRIGERTARASAGDVVLEGAGMKISQPIFGQGNPLPKLLTQQNYRFKLHEDANRYGWQPKLMPKDFISVLSNLTAIKIRATYTNGNRGTGYLDDFRLDSAAQSGFGQRATWIELCSCPQGYIGSFCESCAPGYRHNPPGGGSFAECVPCNCNGHADLCDNDSGACICDHNTSGLNCERCAEGFYGNALSGNLSACQPCPCPNGGPCAVLPNEQIACLSCPTGYGGLQCDACTDGYYGDPKGGQGVTKMCRECDCNGNIDPNAIGNCNTTTGECVKCIYNTYGAHCERCLPGYYGDALAYPKGNCKPCRCNHLGTQPSIDKVGSTYDTAFSCESNGQCRCKPFVTGRMCDRCLDGYYNLTSNNGCETCNCDLIGSYNRSCDTITGQCYCRPGVTGKNCDKCLPLHYDFSIEGCKHCDCDKVGSLSPQCADNGQCNCKPNVEGRRCERCRENKHDKEAGCIDCNVCYNLVQDAVDEHRKKLSELEKILEQIEKDPQIVNDINFDRQLVEVQLRVKSLLDSAVNAQGSDRSLVVQLESLRNRTNKVRAMSKEIDLRLAPISDIVQQGVKNITQAETIIDRASEMLETAQRVLTSEGQNALSKASERSKKFGQQSERMTEIAKQARNIANRHEVEAEKIETLAREALQTAEDANKLALDAIQAQKSNREELQRLDRQLEETTELMIRTLKMAEEARKESEKVYNDTIAVYTNINSITVPSLDSDKLRIEANDLIGQAERILQDALQLLRKNAAALNNTQYQQQDARDLLVEANRQQQIADDLLAEVKAALEKANNSIESGESTLRDAKKTLDTLREFDRVVQESRSKAEDALSKLADIKRLIDEAESKTRDAENALRGALQDAFEARDVAIEAQKLAEKTSDDATRIRQEAATAKARAANLKRDAEALTGKIGETTSRLKVYEDQASSDENLARDALERANQAKSAANDANAKVKSAVETVENIIRALDEVHDIDGNQLAELERKLAESEGELNTANLDQRLSILKSARESQQTWLRNFDAEIDQLKRDVSNIIDISYAIPDKCFRRVRLEVP